MLHFFIITLSIVLILQNYQEYHYTMKLTIIFKLTEILNSPTTILLIALDCDEVVSPICLISSLNLVISAPVSAIPFFKAFTVLLKDTLLSGLCIIRDIFNNVSLSTPIYVNKNKNYILEFFEEKVSVNMLAWTISPKTILKLNITLHVLLHYIQLKARYFELSESFLVNDEVISQKQYIITLANDTCNCFLKCKISFWPFCNTFMFSSIFVSNTVHFSTFVICSVWTKHKHAGINKFVTWHF